MAAVRVPPGRSRRLATWRRRRAITAAASLPLAMAVVAPGETLRVLGLGGADALALLPWLTFGLAALVLVVGIPLRGVEAQSEESQTDAWARVRVELGEVPGLVVAAARLVGGAAAAAVAASAASAALVSAFEALAPGRVAFALVVVALVLRAALRERTETTAASSRATRVAFVVAMGVLLVTAALRCAGGCPSAPSATAPLPGLLAPTPLLALRAAAAGALVLAAVGGALLAPGASGRAAINRPRAALISGLIAALVVGVALLVNGTHVMPTRAGLLERSALADASLAVFGNTPGVAVVQLLVAAALVVAALTALVGYPTIAGALAAERYLPRQLVSTGDRLVYTGGAVALSLVAAGLVLAGGARVGTIAPVWTIAVLAGTILDLAAVGSREIRRRESGWQWRSATTALAVSLLVLLTCAATTIGLGLVALPLLALPIIVMYRIRRHYAWMNRRMRRAGMDAGRSRHRVLLLLDRVDESVARALSWAQSVQPSAITALAVRGEDDLAARWQELAGDVPLEIVHPHAGRGAVAAFRSRLAEEVAAHPGSHTTALVCEELSSSWWEQVRRHRLALRLKGRLLGLPGIVVADLASPIAGPGPYTLEEPVAHHVVVLVNALHGAALQALEYARGLAATDVRALSVNLESGASLRLLAEWEARGIDVPLELIDAPDKSVLEAVRGELRSLRPDGRRTVVTAILPEFQLRKARHQALHNQMALLIKSRLLFERGIVTVSVPLAIATTADDAEWQEEHAGVPSTLTG